MNSSYIFLLPGLASAILVVLRQLWRKATPESLSKDQSKESSSLAEEKKHVPDTVTSQQDFQETIAKLQREIEEKDLALAQVSEMKLKMLKVQHEAEKRTLALAKERKNTSNLQNQKQELVLALLWERTTVANLKDTLRQKDLVLEVQGERIAKLGQERNVTASLTSGLRSNDEDPGLWVSELQEQIKQRDERIAFLERGIQHSMAQEALRAEQVGTPRNVRTVVRG
eukprot:Skav221931  [mRNA]  locus=scaffold195:286469:287149:+ [translate_table: standard]